MSQIRSTYKKLLRQISKTQINQNLPKTNPFHYTDNNIYKYIQSEHRKHAATANLESKHLKAAEQDAINFLQLLEANETHRILLEEYHTKGEKSVEEAANIVGLKVPTNN